MTPEELRSLIAGGESLTVEFKGDQGPLSDADLIEAVICLANGPGGTLLIGAEDDGRVTGLHPRHRTHPGTLAAFIASRTVPPLAIEAAFVDLPEGQVAVLTESGVATWNWSAQDGVRTTAPPGRKTGTRTGNSPVFSPFLEFSEEISE
jgi:hypothetical protein